VSKSDELLTVIVPCLNEEENVRSTVESVYAIADELPVEVDVILVDDGSTDRTRVIMSELAAAHGARMLVNERNKGLGASVLSTYEHIPDRSWITVLPGDGEFVFESIRGFLEMRSDYDVILGYLQNRVIRPVPRRLASFAFSKTVATLYGFPYRYLNGMKMYRVDAFRGIDILSRGHAFNAELLAKAILRNPHLRVGEAPFVAKGRAQGYSKAFRAASITQSLVEVARGFQAVGEYRDEVLKKGSDE
jgi:glycosyltransferase involved in cell wall biosynthesis